MYVWRPPEQKPITPILPFEYGWVRSSSPSRDVADDLRVRHPAGGSASGRQIIPGAWTEAREQMRRDCRVAVVGQLAGDFLGPLSQPGMWWITTTRARATHQVAATGTPR